MRFTELTLSALSLAGLIVAQSTCNESTTSPFVRVTSCPSGYIMSTIPNYTEICPTTTSVFPCSQTVSFYTGCEPIATSSSGTGHDMRRTSRWVARFAQATDVTTTCTSSSTSTTPSNVLPTRTNDDGGRRRSWSPTPGADFAATMITVTKPEVTAPICSFNLSQGQYICPKPTPAPQEDKPKVTVPICSFDLDKGQYVCPKATPAPKARGRALCPPGAGMCNYDDAEAAFTSVV
jgi:hypothetical protein